MGKKFAKKKAIFIVGGVAGALVLIGVLMCGKEDKSSAKEGPIYRLTEVRKLEPLSLRGTIDSDGSSNYYVQESKGEVDQILVKNGQKVSAGTVLFTYKSQTAQDMVDEKQAELKNVRGTLSDAQAKKNALQVKVNAGHSELEDSLAEADDAIRVAAREVSAKEVEVANSQSKIASQVIADIEGIVVVNEKAKKASPDKPLVQVLPETASATGIVSEFDYDKIHEGDVLEISDMNGSQKIPGTIEEISKVPLAKEGDGNSGTSSTSYSFKLKPSAPVSGPRGMSVLLVKSSDQLVVPKSACVEEKGKTFVFVHKNGKVKKTEVELEKISGVEVIKSGVSEKDKVIENPDPNIKNGMEVKAS